MSPRNPGDARDAGAADLLGPQAGTIYVHVQAESGAHRTFVVSPGRARLLRTAFSGWGLALVLALAGSWVYFATQSLRVPVLTQQVAEFTAERALIDTLELRLYDLQRRYAQVKRMLGVVPPDTADSGQELPPR